MAIDRDKFDRCVSPEKLKPIVPAALLLISLATIILNGSSVLYAEETVIPVTFSHTASGIVDTVSFSMDYGGTDTRIFDDFLLQPSDTGRSFILRKISDDPELHRFKTCLTNNTDEIMYFNLSIPGSGFIQKSVQESTLFLKTNEEDIPDFYGQRISGIAFRLTQLDITLLFYWPGFPLFFSDISLKGDVIIYTGVKSVVPMLFPILNE